MLRRAAYMEQRRRFKSLKQDRIEPAGATRTIGCRFYWLSVVQLAVVGILTVAPLVGADPASSHAVAADQAAQQEDSVPPKPKCPGEQAKIPAIGYRDVYQGVPFQAGERATYEMSWGDLKAAYGILEVRKPLKHKGVWHRVFHATADTGEWFKAFFVGSWEVNAVSRPWDFGISQFYMSQNEGKLFSKPFVQTKRLTFDHANCAVTETIEQPGKEPKVAEFALEHGATDALGAVFDLRARTYKIGRGNGPWFTHRKRIGGSTRNR